MKSKALEILRTLIRHQETVEKEARLTDLLRDPDSEGTPGWFMHVPRCFNDSLDIRQTTRIKDGRPVPIWTQGCNFSFKAGDTIYDSPNASGPWSEAVSLIKVAIQVRSTTDLGQQGPGGSEPRQPGSVTFEVLRPAADRKMLQTVGFKTLSQFEFVQMLISGEGLPKEVML